MPLIVTSPLEIGSVLFGANSFPETANSSSVAIEASSLSEQEISKNKARKDTTNGFIIFSLNG